MAALLTRRNCLSSRLWTSLSGLTNAKQSSASAFKMMGNRPSDQIEGLPEPAAELPWSSDFVMQAIEVLPVTGRAGALLSFRPDCADSFVVGWPAGAKPEEVAAAALRQLELTPLVLHSTSWRHTNGEVMLTYLAIVPADANVPASWETVPVAHSELARGGAVNPPPIIGVQQVLEHALRHLAWLVQDDEEIARALPGWEETLAGYSPEPFRALSGPPS